ncbi:MAG: AarF/ABC1/UbiB kinase family protein [Saprospiraceae bacterium]|nr:AarF/ABC1/UbiB kinase family protein [Saprospiraceae bacterium]
MTELAKHKNSPSLLARYEKVFSVLFKYGFEDVLAHPPFNRFLPKFNKYIPRREGKPVYEFTRYERIRMVCEELGTTFIKFAQIAANRPDVLPEELIAELEQFQDQVPFIPTQDIVSVITEDLGKAPEELFERFDREPIASASIAQVHRARLVGGKEVVLKIMRPGIDVTIEEDIHILKQLAGLMESYFPQYEAFQPMELVKMFERSIRKELKFTVEANNLRRFAQQFRGNERVYVPDLYPEFCSDRIICMEYIDGHKITDLDTMQQIGYTGPELAVAGINLYFEQVFEHGFFHADPHPGNIFVMPDKKICFIDYGMMGAIMDSDKELLADLLLAVSERDVDGLKQALLRFTPDGTVENEKELDYDIVEFFDIYSSMTLDQIEGTEIIEGLNAMFFAYKIKIPGNLLLLLKALVIIEGVGLTLDPHYNIIANIDPFVRRLLRQKYGPDKMAKRAVKTLADITKMATGLPEDMETIVRKIREGKLRIEFEHKGLEGLYQKMDEVSNRMAVSILLAAILLGSSLIVLAEVPPYVGNIPALGFGGFVIAGLIALRLAISILRHGKF